MSRFFKIHPNIKELFRDSYFLRKHQISERTLKVLKDIYPQVDWSRVDFYEGLPWFTPLVAPYVTAQALPDFYSFGRYRIYLKKFDEDRAQCVADIVHEAFHVLQGMHFARGYGFGFFRVWMVYYIALFGKYGYRNNPFEIPAYNQEYRFLEYCAKCGYHGITPRLPDDAFKTISTEKALVFPDIRFRYRENSLLLIGGILFCAIVTIAKPFVDALAFLAHLILRKKKVGKEKLSGSPL